MNLGTIGAILGAIASFLAILAYLNNGVRNNRARLRAEKGRVISLAKIVEIQGKRITALEIHASRTEDESFFQPNEPLIDLENEAKDEYKKHHTDLT
ncbi:hypothetical protein [Microcoleus sp.]|uniref:hypothetical protein n=1 Tax=Microcoleus sp. TaxID=44472 RepID=UPI00403E939D